ncbi:uncharacterized protein BYT42DRAFT_609250 [Radiomyces spectabilis]|uniref:uncharacterized protein n=1 Tax=Radiomyces spectabilis TaxID=64574 RepID=UPI00221E8F76|nr:uncharacterized protein BYT42DRAFT_609250 [Radiomyces spectabilis]KAI8393456.1 hypothetical protein BYT42DRAFT_609250 [Radiomyces spectabilis]
MSSSGSLYYPLQMNRNDPHPPSPPRQVSTDPHRSRHTLTNDHFQSTEHPINDYMDVNPDEAEAGSILISLANHANRTTKHPITPHEHQPVEKSVSSHSMSIRNLLDDDERAPDTQHERAYGCGGLATPSSYDREISLTKRAVPADYEEGSQIPTKQIYSREPNGMNVNATQIDDRVHDARRYHTAAPAFTETPSTQPPVKPDGRLRMSSNAGYGSVRHYAEYHDSMVHTARLSQHAGRMEGNNGRSGNSTVSNDPPSRNHPSSAYSSRNVGHPTAQTDIPMTMNHNFSRQYDHMRRNPRVRRNALHAYISYMTYADLARRRPNDSMADLKGFPGHDMMGHPAMPFHTGMQQPQPQLQPQPQPPPPQTHTQAQPHAPSAYQHHAPPPPAQGNHSPASTPFPQEPTVHPHNRHRTYSLPQESRKQFMHDMHKQHPTGYPYAKHHPRYPDSQMMVIEAEPPMLFASHSSTIPEKRHPHTYAPNFTETKRQQKLFNGAPRPATDASLIGPSPFLPSSPHLHSARHPHRNNGDSPTSTRSASPMQTTQDTIVHRPLTAFLRAEEPKFGLPAARSSYFRSHPSMPSVTGGPGPDEFHPSASLPLTSWKSRDMQAKKGHGY